MKRKLIDDADGRLLLLDPLPDASTGIRSRRSSAAAGSVLSSGHRSEPSDALIRDGIEHGLSPLHPSVPTERRED